MILPFDIHTHQRPTNQSVISIQSFNLTDTDLSALPKEHLISVGLHPWYCTAENFESAFEKLASAAKYPNVKMIGECGLDKLKGAEIPLQLEFLELQIKLAQTLSKPLILHCVKAFEELIYLKEKLKVNVPMIVHGFNKNEVLGLQLIKKGFYLSFGNAILRNDSQASKLLKQLDNFFLETDNSGLDIEEIYQQAAILKKSSAELLKERIFADWKKITDF